MMSPIGLNIRHRIIFSAFGGGGSMWVGPEILRRPMGAVSR